MKWFVDVQFNIIDNLSSHLKDELSLTANYASLLIIFLMYACSKLLNGRAMNVDG